MALMELPVGGRASLAADEKVPVQAATAAMNCYMDDDTVVGRNGYRSALQAAVGSGNPPQGMWRYRIDGTTAYTIVVIDGSVHRISDPSTDLLSDGTDTNMGTPFASTDIISASQLGRYLYLVNNTTPAIFVRVGPDLTLSVIGNIPAGNAPTQSAGNLALVKLTSLTPAVAGGAGYDTEYTDWHRMTDGAGGHCPAGGSLTYTLAAPIVATSAAWLQVFATCPTESSGNGRLTVDVATVAGAWEPIGSFIDFPGPGSPNVLWASLSQLTPATLASIARIRFTLTGHDGHAGVYGYMYIPTAPAAGTQTYDVTFYNSLTGQESAPTPDVTATYSSDQVQIPQYHNVIGDHDDLTDWGMSSASPDAVPRPQNANAGQGISWPDVSVYAPVITFNGNIPAGARFPLADTVRLWRVTDTGRRIVTTLKLTTSATVTYSLTDDQGSATSMHQLYKAGGGAPTSMAMASFSGRLITAYLNRLSCSSFEPFAATTGVDPYPQFPAIPVIDADGFAFDFSPSPKEQVRALVGQESGADILYLVSNEAVYVMEDMDPNVEHGGAQSIPVRIYNRGAIGRSAVLYAENSLFWAAYDGIYFAQNRVQVDELSKPVRRLVTDWLKPSANTVLFYRRRKLYVVDGLNFLRYDFVTGRWSEGTLAHSPRYAAQWIMDGSATRSITVSAQDTFTGANSILITSRPCDTGQTWFRPVWGPNAYGPIIYNNKQTGDGMVGDLEGAWVLNLISPTADVVVSATLTRPFESPGTAFIWQAVARANNAGSGTYYRAGFTSGSSDPTQNGWVMEKITNGAIVRLAFVQALFVTGDTHYLRFECTDSYKRLYIDGTLVLASSDNAITGAGYSGIRAFNQRVNGGVWADDFTTGALGAVSVLQGEQTWLLADGGYVVRWQESATSDLMIGATPGTAIPAWTYSTGYFWSPIQFTVDTLFADATGAVTVTAYKTLDESVSHSLTFRAGEVEQSAWPDLLGYKMRLKFQAANAVRLRRFAWNLGGLDKVGA